MNIPDFQTIMLPLMELASDKEEHRLRDTYETLSAKFNLTEEERQALLASGSQTIFVNRVSWAKIHLERAGLLHATRRAYFKITQRGLDVLSKNPSRIDMNFLRQYPEYQVFTRRTAPKEDEKLVEFNPIQATPDEMMDEAYHRLRKTLAQDLLERVKTLSPSFFEKLVVELLVKMGYGGSIKDAGRATKLTNDEGIDGIIKEDKLGLDVIYIQAKRYTDKTVGRPEIQSFVGALDGQRATKGIFITTSTFGSTASEYVKTITKKVILIDGEQLADFMIDYGLGVSTFGVYEIKRIDNDYFGE